MTRWRVNGPEGHVVRMKLLAVLVLAMAAPPALAGSAACEEVAKKADADPVMLVPRVYFTVTGAGRLYFHSAPDPACGLPRTFVIPGDSLIGYSAYGPWTSVMFTTPDGDPVQGWVRSDRLRATGTLGAP